MTTDTKNPVVEIKDGRKVETWRKDGIPHRTDGPAQITYHENGNINHEEWYQSGERHREDGPAWLEYKEDGTLHWEYWYKNGKQHRDNDEPAEIMHSKGSPSMEWYQNGLCHREGKPAQITYQDGHWVWEIYNQHGKFHIEF